MNNNGMISIEASVIIPVTIAVTMLLIWLGIYYYNQNVFDECTAKAAIMGSHMSDLDNNEIEDIAMENIVSLLNENLVMIDDADITVTVEYGYVTVEASGVLNIPNFFLFGNIYSDNSWSISVKNSAPRLHSSSFVRMITNLK